MLQYDTPQDPRPGAMTEPLVLRVRPRDEVEEQMIGKLLASRRDDAPAPITYMTQSVRMTVELDVTPGELLRLINFLSGLVPLT